MVTQKRLATINGRGLTKAFTAILALVFAILAVAWIAMAMTSGAAPQTQAAPSSAPTYQGHPLPLRPS